ncbi:Alpha/Beta hydrolase protein [Mycena rosella]|uniref:Alpha/Beta hydrolase protein n=1 Tax=Mycena rosella TaxID=1033263 RepID=A0AAD7GMM3_MYCRO|nr:Alpha/Beta hydrolase protein [Mycena rosella]
MSLLSISLGLLGVIAPVMSRSVPVPLHKWPQKPQPQNHQNNTIRWLDCHDRIPAVVQAEFNVTTSTPLPPSLFCGEMDVPMDYSKPHASDNNITIGIAMNRPKKSDGVIIFHAGGPGIDAGTQAWANAFNFSQEFAGLENFDFLAINTRGIEFSNPLKCSSGVFFNDVPFAFPTSKDQYSAYQAAMINFISSCTNHSTPAGIMEHVGTADVIQDWDAVRAALGYEKVHFAGVSYGTFVSAAYVARFPERIGRFVIDAVIPHGMGFQEMITDQIVAINRLLLRSDAFCMTDPTCPFYGQGKGSVVKAWETLLAQAIQEPLAAPSCGPGTGCNAPVTATDLRFAVHATFRSDSDFPLFNFALNASMHGDASLFGYIPQQDIRETVVSPLLCSDFKIEDSWKTFEGFNNFTLNARSNDTASIIYSQTWQFVLMCAAWPFAVPEQTTLPNDLPIMWMTSDFDLNLPTEETTFAWQQTPNATLVIRHGDDHTSISLTGPAGAAAALAREFLKTGGMPGAQHDAQVTVIPPGGTRGPVPDPYDVPTGAVAGDISVIENIVWSYMPES